MTLAAAVLIAIGITDLARPSATGPTKQQRLRSWMLAAATSVTLAWGWGLPGWATALGFAVVAGWLLATPAPKTGTWALAGLAVVLVVLIAAVQPALTPATAPFPTWFADSAPSLLTEVSFARAVVALAALTFVLNTCNIVVRVLIERTDIDRAVVPGDDADASTVQPKRALKGGRYLGPIERLLIIGLGLAGQYAAIGAVVGAKSIIRFPEISGSPDRASTAEYFLIGSGLSWGLALLMLAAAIVTP